MRWRILFMKYKGVLAYCFFGVCTTAVNLIMYWMMAHVVGLTTVCSTIIAWFGAVLFAYITNRKWVFFSKRDSYVELFEEIFSFFVCRLATGILDWLIMYIFVELLLFNDMVVKICANTIVIVCNYIVSKFYVFKERNH